MKPIQTIVPERRSGQQDVLSLAVPPMETVRVGFVGLGLRGQAALMRWCHIPHACIGAICDIQADHLHQAQQVLLDHGHDKVRSFESFEQMCQEERLDLVYICTDWLHHVPIALCAMEHGKHVAVEVPAALTLEDIWLLVDTAERTRRHCIMLENCCYDYFEQATLNMVRQGLFGDVLHAEGAYFHDLDDKWSPWRLDYNLKHRGDVYPTHGMGPACQVLDIHRSDTLDYLVSMDTVSMNGKQKMCQLTGDLVLDFKNGDQTSTLIRTKKGRTILIQHDVMTPRPYSRQYQIVGTKGYANKYPKEELCFGHQSMDDADCQHLLDKYLPDDIKSLRDEAPQYDDRGGISYIMDYRLVNCLLQGKPLDMDVYDLAEWCSLAPLTGLSIENGSVPVEIPDFLRRQEKR